MKRIAAGLVSALICYLSGMVIGGGVSPTADMPEHLPGTIAYPTALTLALGCWQQNVPADMVGKFPGHAILKGGRYTTDISFALNNLDQTVSFCR
jgi:hypothetical protein